MFTNTKMRQQSLQLQKRQKIQKLDPSPAAPVIPSGSALEHIGSCRDSYYYCISENLNIGDLCQCLFLILKFPRHLPTSPFEGEPSFSWRPITILCSSELQMGTCKAEGKPAESLPPVLPCQTLPVLYNMISSAYSWIFSFLGFSLRLNSVLQKFFRKIQIYISTMDPRLPCFEVQMDKN